MTPSAEPLVIVHVGEFGTQVYPGTVEVALQLLNREMSPSYIRIPSLMEAYAAYELEKEGGPRLIAPSDLTPALDEVLRATQEGADMPALRRLLHGPVPRGDAPDTRPEVRFEPCWQAELVQWCFKHWGKAGAGGVGYLFSSDLESAKPLATLSFLDGAAQRLGRGNGVQFVDGDALAGAEELRILRENRWKETAKEVNVISRYTQFLSTWAEGKWEVVPIVAPRGRT